MMRLKSRVSKLPKLEKAINKAFIHTAETLDTKFQEIISEPRYWSGFEESITYRANGSVVMGAFRNIEDLGNLKSSQDMTFKLNSVVYSWDGEGVTPVLSVFYGHRTESGFVPGRDWITPAKNELDLPQIFSNKVKSLI